MIFSSYLSTTTTIKPFIFQQIGDRLEMKSYEKKNKSEKEGKNKKQ
jgi:hypothetical protein